MEVGFCWGANEAIPRPHGKRLLRDGGITIHKGQNTTTRGLPTVHFSYAWPDAQEMSSWNPGQLSFA